MQVPKLDYTSTIDPFSSEHRVLSIFALKFHLNIDNKEHSCTNSKSGKHSQTATICYGASNLMSNVYKYILKKKLKIQFIWN